MGEVYGALITLLALWKTLLQPGEITQHMPSYRISLKVSAILGLVADPVIEPIARLELEAAGTLVVAASSPGSILHHPRGLRVGHGGGVVVIRTPVRPNSNSTEFCALVVLNYSSYVVLG